MEPHKKIAIQAAVSVTLAMLLLLLTLFAFHGLSVAWFSHNASVSASGMSVTVAGAENLTYTVYALTPSAAVAAGDICYQSDAGGTAADVTVTVGGTEYRWVRTESIDLSRMTANECRRFLVTVTVSGASGGATLSGVTLSASLTQENVAAFGAYYFLPRTASVSPDTAAATDATLTGKGNLTLTGAGAATSCLAALGTEGTHLYPLAGGGSAFIFDFYLSWQATDADADKPVTANLLFG